MTAVRCQACWFRAVLGKLHRVGSCRRDGGSASRRRPWRNRFPTVRRGDSAADRTVADKRTNNPAHRLASLLGVCAAERLCVMAQTRLLALRTTALEAWLDFRHVFWGVSSLGSSRPPDPPGWRCRPLDPMPGPPRGTQNGGPTAPGGPETTPKRRPAFITSVLRVRQ